MLSASTPSFRTDPLRYFDHQLRTAGDAFWLPTSALCVAEPTAAKRVLANPDGLFEEHSDFFHTRRGAFGPRPVQVALGRSARALLSAHVAARAGDLPDTLGRELAGATRWPDAGNHFIYRHLEGALVTPEHRPRIGATVEQILERGVLAGARESRSRLSRAFFRRRVFRALIEEVERRVEELGKSGSETPRDLFDVLALAVGPGVSAADLAELYVPFLFAVAGSVGFTLGWAIYLLGTQPPTAPADQVPPEWIVREALRLWPIAWQLARRPATTHEVAGVEVTPRHHVLVSPYVTHRHPAYWSEPDRFRPERWEDASAHRAFLPFGWGPHTCAAAALSLELVRDVVAVLLRDYRLSVTPGSGSPFTGPSLAPPPFELVLSPRVS